MGLASLSPSTKSLSLQVTLLGRAQLVSFIREPSSNQVIGASSAGDQLMKKASNASTMTSVEPALLSALAARSTKTWAETSTCATTWHH